MAAVLGPPRRYEYGARYLGFATQRSAGRFAACNGNALGLQFNKTQIKNGTYAPTAHGKLEEEQGRVRELAVEVLEGRRPLGMWVVNLPNQNEPQRADG